MLEMKCGRFVVVRISVLNLMSSISVVSKLMINPAIFGAIFIGNKVAHLLAYNKNHLSLN